MGFVSNFGAGFKKNGNQENFYRNFPKMILLLKGGLLDALKLGPNLSNSMELSVSHC